MGVTRKWTWRVESSAQGRSTTVLARRGGPALRDQPQLARPVGALGPVGVPSSAACIHSTRLASGERLNDMWQFFALGPVREPGSYMPIQSGMRSRVCGARPGRPGLGKDEPVCIWPRSGDQAELACAGDGLGAVGRAELAQDVADVLLDGIEGDHELVRDDLVRPACRQHL